MAKRKKFSPKAAFAIVRYCIGLLLFVPAAYTAFQGKNVVSLVLFLLLIAAETAAVFAESHEILDIRIVLTVSWFGAVALSRLQLSSLQEDWTKITWLCVGLYYFGFMAGFDLVQILSEKRKRVMSLDAVATPASYLRNVRSAILIIAALSLAGFLAECIRFNFEMPILVRNKPHAYTDFHITGIHYFVVSGFLAHGLTVYYFFAKKKAVGVVKTEAGSPKKEGGVSKKEALFLIAVNMICFLIPVALLSKLQIVFGAGITLLILIFLLRLSNKKKLLIVGIGLALAAGLFVIVTIGRHYPDGYLQEVFAFYDPTTSVAIQYPYIYVVNNLENFNLLTMKLSQYSYGTRQLYPFICLTGLKFLPSMGEFLSVERFFTEPTLTTVSVIYDAYGDFSYFGVALLALLFGAFSSYAYSIKNKYQKAFGLLLYAQLWIYAALSFFTTWFSNPTTWFYLLATLAIGFWCTQDGFFKFHGSRLKAEMKL